LIAQRLVVKAQVLNYSGMPDFSAEFVKVGSSANVTGMAHKKDTERTDTAQPSINIIKIRGEKRI